MYSRREMLCDMGAEDTVVFGNPDYDDAIMGLTHDGRVVYDYDKMVEHLVNKDGMSEEEASDFICYNTLRAIPYGGENAPVIMYPLREEVST